MRQLSYLSSALILTALSAEARAVEVEPTTKFSRIEAGSAHAFFAQTPTAVGTLLTNNNEKIVDVHVAQASPLLLTGATVRTTHPYSAAWWWYYDKTAANVGTELTNHNARLTNLQGYVVGGQTRYVAAMVDNTGSNSRAWAWFPDTTLANVTTHVNSTGDRVIDMSTWVDGSSTRHFSAVTIANVGSDEIEIPAGAPQWQNNVTAADIQAFLSTWPGSRVIDLESEGSGRFLVVYAFDANVPNLATDSTAIAPDSWFYKGLTSGTTPMYERSISHVTRTDGSRIIAIQPDTLNSQGTQTGYGVSLLRSQALPTMSALPVNNNNGSGQFNYLDGRIRTFMRQYGVAGAAIAIAKGDRLVHARAYGYSDTELGTDGTLAKPTTLFRVGSISKLITTTAILQLIENNELTPVNTTLTLNTRVFRDIIRPYLGLTTADEGAAAFTPGGGLEAITVEQVLNHSAGWSDGSIGSGTPCVGNPLVETVCIADEIGMNTTPSCEDLIANWAISDQLARSPGSLAEYSNFGFCVAQTIVDAIAPQGYREYIEDNIIDDVSGADLIDNSNRPQLKPSSDTYVASQWEAHDYVFPQEALVPSKLVPQGTALVEPPYGGVPMFPGLGTGGWKASAVGLLKLATSINQSSASGQILNAASFSSIFDPGNRSMNASGGTFGLGTEMNVGNGDVYKTGGVAGGGGIVVFKNLLNSYTASSCSNCITWVALVNTAGGGGGLPDPPGGINQAMIDALGNATVLAGINNATVDMFPTYGL
ncbi:serine hydrolase domain-containing protein [Sorangium sp. So ce1667]